MKFISLNPMGQLNPVNGVIWVEPPDQVGSRLEDGTPVLIETPFGTGSPFQLGTDDITKAAKRNWVPTTIDSTDLRFELHCNTTLVFDTDPSYAPDGGSALIAFGADEPDSATDIDPPGADFTGGSAVKLAAETEYDGARVQIGSADQINLDDSTTSVQPVFLAGTMNWAWLGYRFFYKTITSEVYYAILSATFTPTLEPNSPGFNWIEATTPYPFPIFRSNWLVTGITEIEEDWGIPSNYLLGGPPNAGDFFTNEERIDIAFEFEERESEEMAGSLSFRGYHLDSDDTRRSEITFVEPSRLIFPGVYLPLAL